MNTDQKSNCHSSFKAIHEQFARMFALSEANPDPAISLRSRFVNILTPRSQGLMRDACDTLQPHNIPDLMTPLTRLAENSEERFH